MPQHTALQRRTTDSERPTPDRPPVVRFRGAPATGLPLFLQSRSAPHVAAETVAPTPAESSPEGPSDAPSEVEGEAPEAERSEAMEASRGRTDLEAEAPEADVAGPEANPTFQAVARRVHGVAGQQGRGDDARRKAADAQAAAPGGPSELDAQAQRRKVGELDAQEPQPFDEDAFKQALRQKVDQLAPKNLAEARDFKKNGQSAQIQGAVQGRIEQSKQVAAGPVASVHAEAPDPTASVPKETRPLPPTPAGTAPPAVGAEEAVPAPRAASVGQRMVEDAGALDGQLAESGLTDTELTRSGEPSFRAAVLAKAEAQNDAQRQAEGVRADEQGQLAEARGEALALADEQLGGMRASRRGRLAEVVAQQNGVREQDTARRDAVDRVITPLYEQTQQEVQRLLDDMDREADQQFDDGATGAQGRFEGYVDREIQAYLDRRYSGLGVLRRGRDLFLGLPDEVDDIYTTGRDRYLAEMDQVIDRVARGVVGKLNAAKAAIDRGARRVEAAVAELDPSLQALGREAAAKIQSRFDALRGQVDSRRDQLVDGLAQRYSQRLQAIDADIDKREAANRGLVDRATDAARAVVLTIRRLKEMLLSVGGDVVSVVGSILRDPVGFLGNLIAGVGAGLRGFVANIGSHLKDGLMGWLFGQVAAAGIAIPTTFDAKSVMTLVLGVLGLTWANFRALAARMVGEPLVAAMETTVEVFQVVRAEGPGGLWRWIKDQVGNLGTMVLGAIREFVVTKIVMAGITWVLSLLNPAGGFVRAVKLIIDIVRFFIERAAQIMDLVRAITGALGAIAKGAIGAIAKAVEGALKRALPVALSFLASLLGLGGIAAKIKGVIDRAQEPVTKAIRWVVGKVARAFRRLRGGKPDPKPGDAKDGDGPKKVLTAKEAHDATIAKFTDPGKRALMQGHGRFAPGHAGHGFSVATRDAVDEIGYADGDHSAPSIRVPGTNASTAESGTESQRLGRGHWVPDHQPPDTLLGGGASGLTFRFYPHSMRSMRRQGGVVRVYKMRMKEARGKGESDWAEGVQSSWFW